jgi:hypothetical protein
MQAAFKPGLNDGVYLFAAAQSPASASTSASFVWAFCQWCFCPFNMGAYKVSRSFSNDGRGPLQCTEGRWSFMLLHVLLLMLLKLMDTLSDVCYASSLLLAHHHCCSAAAVSTVC